MASLPHRDLSANPRVGLYGRVSTDEQAERGTIDAQTDFLRRYADLYGLTVAGEYWDDGWSGTHPLDQRPDGRRLLDDATAGLFSEVVVTKVDRLGRSLAVLLDAHTALEGKRVTLRSATEPFDTGNPMGRFLFQLLGSMAELDRSTLLEKLSRGRDRVARGGRWTSGPIPFGYDLDADGCLTPSLRLVPGLHLTEAELARDIFTRIAEGSSTVAECRRLNALGVPTHRRYGGGATVTVGETWLPSRINAMIRNSVYAGTHTVKSQFGPIERQVPALVSREVWERAQAQLVRNRALSTRNARHLYLLRGLIRCEHCGAGYSGTKSSSRVEPWVGYYYRCNGQLSVVRPEAADRCRAKALPAAWLEATVWEDCRRWIQDPGEPLAEAQRQLRDRMGESATLDAERRRFHQQAAAKDAERERILTLYRRNRITVTEAEAQLDAIAAETATLRQMLDGLASQAALAAAFEAHLTEATALLLRLRGRLADVEQTNDWATKREIVEALVARITVRTDGDERGRKRATVRVRYACGEPREVVSTKAVTIAMPEPTTHARTTGMPTGTSTRGSTSKRAHCREV